MRTKRSTGMPAVPRSISVVPTSEPSGVQGPSIAVAASNSPVSVGPAGPAWTRSSEPSWSTTSTARSTASSPPGSRL